MKGIINAIRLVLPIFLILSINAFADEGWWTYLRIAGGSLYSQIEHPDIALEKEVLIYKGIEDKQQGKCEVHFLFKNTAEKSVSVEVGFPVKIIIPLKGLRPISPGWPVLEKISGDKRFERWPPSKVEVENLNLNIRKFISWREFEKLNKFWEKNKIANIAITQDGRDVDIESVLVDGQVTKDKIAVIHFHFLHRLFFKPKTFSDVVVKYSSYSTAMWSGTPLWTPYIIWRYILGTGRTWRGPIKAIYIILPDHLSPELPKPFTRVGDFKNNTIFMTKNYEPLEKDEVDIRYVGGLYLRSYVERTPLVALRGELFDLFNPEIMLKSIEEPTVPAQSFVVLRNASSYLPQRTWVNSFFASHILPHKDPLVTTFFDAYYFRNFHEIFESYRVESVYVTCKNIGFYPLSLFDGIPESAWCEGVKGNGIGQWVEFELKEDVSGLAVHNGFKKVKWYLEKTQGKKVSQLEAVYSNNNRVKLLEFVSSDGKIKHKIGLKDTPAKQSFENLHLPKGIYRLYIRDIYKGKKHDDTCLGEIEFYPASARRIVEEDEFLKNIFFRQQNISKE